MERRNETVMATNLVEASLNFAALLLFPGLLGTRTTRHQLCTHPQSPQLLNATLFLLLSIIQYLDMLQSFRCSQWSPRITLCRHLIPVSQRSAQRTITAGLFPTKSEKVITRTIMTMTVTQRKQGEKIWGGMSGSKYMEIPVSSYKTQLD